MKKPYQIDAQRAVKQLDRTGAIGCAVKFVRNRQAFVYSPL